MTKEDVYEKITMQELGGNPNGTRQEIIWKSMDYFAGICSVSFAEWIEDNDYWCKPENTVTTLEDKLLPFKLWYRHGQSVGGIKTEQLYELYLQSLK